MAGKTENVNFRITKETSNKLEYIAQKYDVPKSYILTQGLKGILTQLN
jgi:hypothetical protein